MPKPGTSPLKKLNLLNLRIYKNLKKTIKNENIN